MYENDGISCDFVTLYMKHGSLNSLFVATEKRFAGNERYVLKIVDLDDRNGKKKHPIRLLNSRERFKSKALHAIRE